MTGKQADMALAWLWVTSLVFGHILALGVLAYGFKHGVRAFSWTSILRLARSRRVSGKQPPQSVPPISLATVGDSTSDQHVSPAKVPDTWQVGDIWLQQCFGCRGCFRWSRGQPDVLSGRVHRQLKCQ